MHKSRKYKQLNKSLLIIYRQKIEEIKQHKHLSDGRCVNINGLFRKDNLKRYQDIKK